METCRPTHPTGLQFVTGDMLMKRIHIHNKTSKTRLYLLLLPGILLLLSTTAQALKPGSNDLPPGQAGGTIDLGGGYITNMGFINATELGGSFTNSRIRSMAVSVGQLGGVNPATGEIITDANNLLPLVSSELDVTRSAFFYTNIYIAGDTFVYGAFFGSGAGLTNIPARNISGSLVSRPEVQGALATKLDADGVWNSINANVATLTDLESLIDALNASVTDTNNPHRVTAAQTGALPITGGSMSGAIDMRGMVRIINLPEPANDQDAVTKAYLDGRLRYIPPRGDIDMGIYTNAP